MKTYKPRIVDRELKRKLDCIGAVLIEGPKWCGKTTTAEQQAATSLRGKRKGVILSRISDQLEGVYSGAKDVNYK